MKKMNVESILKQNCKLLNEFCYSGENVTKSKVPTVVVPGDHIIPITVSVNESFTHVLCCTKHSFCRGTCTV